MGKNTKFKFLELSEKEYNAILEANKKRKKIRMFGSIDAYNEAMDELHSFLDKTTSFTPTILNYQHIFMALHAYAFDVEESHVIHGRIPIEYVYHEGICFEVIYREGFLLTARKPLIAI